MIPTCTFTKPTLSSCCVLLVAGYTHPALLFYAVLRRRWTLCSPNVGALFHSLLIVYFRTAYIMSSTTANVVWFDLTPRVSILQLWICGWNALTHTFAQHVGYLPPPQILRAVSSALVTNIIPVNCEQQLFSVLEFTRTITHLVLSAEFEVCVCTCACVDVCVYVCVCVCYANLYVCTYVRMRGRARWSHNTPLRARHEQDRFTWSPSGRSGTLLPRRFSSSRTALHTCQ